MVSWWKLYTTKLYTTRVGGAGFTQGDNADH